MQPLAKFNKLTVAQLHKLLEFLSDQTQGTSFLKEFITERSHIDITNWMKIVFDIFDSVMQTVSNRAF